MIFDTDIFILVQKGYPAAATLLDQTERRALSIITYIELLQGARSARELKINKLFVKQLGAELLPLTQEIGHLASYLVESFTLKSGLRMADALIAATAIENDLPLISANSKHYALLPSLKFKPFTI